MARTSSSRLSRLRAWLGLRGQQFVVFVLLVVVASLVGGVVAERAIDGDLVERTELELDRHARAAAVSLQALGADASITSIDALADRLGEATGARITFVDDDGVVRGDSQVDEAALAALPNHRDRPELAQARAQGKGLSRRQSATVGVDLLYLARGTTVHGHPMFIRVALPLTELAASRSTLRWLFVGAGLITLVIAAVGSAVASHLATRRVRALLTRARQQRADLQGTASDDDEVEALRRHFDELTAGVERLERARRDFVANVSHELRTPCSVILANSEMLIDGALDDRERAGKFVEAIHRNAERLSRLISDLLDLSRIESGKVVFARVPVDVRTIAEHAVDSLDPRAREKGTHVEVRIEEGLTLEADPRALDQILINLVDNAIKYTPGGGHVHVRALRHGDAVRLLVEDDGPGVDAAHRARLFERFYRVDAGRSREVGGTGLGLAIVKHLAEAMGGSVGVDGVEPHGVRFIVDLPSAHVPPAVHAPASV